MTEEAQSGRWYDGAAIAVVALAIYVLLGQDTMYEVDAQGIVKALATGVTGHYLHFLYLPVVRGLGWLLSPMELGAYELARAASAIGMALGVAFSHRACCVLGLSRANAAIATGLVATAPAVVFFATIVEFHGVFFAFAGLVWWMLARLLKRPSFAHAVVLGVSTAIAGFVHGTGQLLIPLVVAWFVAGRFGRPRFVRAALLALVVMATHAVLLRGLPLLLGLEAGNLTEYWRRYLETLPPWTHAAESLWYDWLYAFTPLSVLWLPAFGVRSERLRATALSGVLLLYLTACFLLIPDGYERGAYQLPLALAAALLACRVLRRPVLLFSIAFGLAIGFLEVQRHDTATGGYEYVQALRDAGREDAVFFLGDLDEVNPIVRYAPETEYVPFYDVIGVISRAPPQQYPQLFAGVEALVAGYLAAGKTVIWCDGAQKLVLSTDVGKQLREYLGTRFVFEAVRSRGVSLSVVKRRS